MPDGAPEGALIMTRRTVAFLGLLAGLIAPAAASANAVLLEGEQGDVVLTLRQEIQTRVQAQVATTEVTTTFSTLSADTALFCFGVPEQAAEGDEVLILDGEEQQAEVTVGDHTLFVGEVLAARAEKEAFDETWRLTDEEARPLHHLGSDVFATLSEPFHVP